MSDYDEQITGEGYPSPEDNVGEPIESGESEAAYRDSYNNDAAQSADREMDANASAEYIAETEPSADISSATSEMEAAPYTHYGEPDPDTLPEMSSEMPPTEGAESLEELPSRPPEMFRLTRIEELTAAIERYPNAPVNYVLRGEALLVDRNFEEAFSDFQLALHLIEDRAQTDNWEYIDRALADRAKLGLRRIQRD